MGVILAQLEISNPLDKTSHMEFSAMVDTGATYLTLPMEWKEKLGKANIEYAMSFETATQTVEEGIIAGPFTLRINENNQISTDILFIHMQPDENGNYEPLLGHIPLQQSLLAVDMMSHRLMKVKAADLRSPRAIAFKD